MAPLCWLKPHDLRGTIPLAQFTTFKIGGPARFFCRSSSEDALVEAIRLAHGKQLPVFVFLVSSTPISERA
jgi:UDP-N-acetylmuramate dehydrogenase